MRRALAVIVILIAALLIGACGSYGDGANAPVETSFADSITAVLDADAPLVELRSVDCTGERPTLECLASLGVGNTVVQIRLAVDVGADDCWTADARRTIVLGAGSETNPLADLSAASDLKGCLQ
ncbi:MAG: hypothetical protein ACR2J9_06610 [Gaiellales bacterium]